MTLEKYRHKFSESLEEGETLIDAGMAQWVEFAERAGRGGGEGVLGLTDRRILFKFDRPHPQGSGLRVPIEHVIDVHTKWIIVPGMRQIFIELSSDAERMSFYAGKHFAKQLEREISRLI